MFPLPLFEKESMQINYVTKMALNKLLIPLSPFPTAGAPGLVFLLAHYTALWPLV